MIARQRTSFSFPIDGCECCERGEKDAKVGEWDEEGEPIHGDGQRACELSRAMEGVTSDSTKVQLRAARFGFTVEVL